MVDEEVLADGGVLADEVLGDEVLGEELLIEEPFRDKLFKDKAKPLGDDRVGYRCDIPDGGIGRVRSKVD